MYSVDIEAFTLSFYALPLITFNYDEARLNLT